MATRLNEDFDEWKKKRATKAGASKIKGKSKRKKHKRRFLG